MDFLVGPTNDWVVEDGTFKLVTDAAYIRQTWLTRARKFKGEWLLDTDDGVPYVQELLEKRTERRVVEVFRNLTLTTPGVIAVQRVSLDAFDLARRHVSISVEALIEGPESLVFKYDGYLPGEDTTCTPDFPLKFAGANTWLDAQDISASTYISSVTTAQNKAGTGQGVGNAGITPVSPINNKRAFSFDTDKYIEVVDTPAIRHGDGSMTLLVVLRSSVVADGTYGIVAMHGVDSGANERYMLYLRVDAGVTYIRFMSKRVGFVSEISEAAYAGTTSPCLIMVKITAAGDLVVAANGGYLDMSLDTVTQRSLDGGYVVGSTIDNTDLKENYFDGHIGEIIVYDRALSTADVESVTVCLARKWGIEVAAIENVGYGFFPYGISAHGL